MLAILTATLLAAVLALTVLTTTVAVGALAACTLTVAIGALTVLATTVAVGTLAVLTATLVLAAILTATVAVGSLAVLTATVAVGALTVLTATVAVGALTVLAATVTVGALTVLAATVTVGALTVLAATVAVGALAVLTATLILAAILTATVAVGSLTVLATTVTVGALAVAGWFARRGTTLTGLSVSRWLATIRGAATGDFPTLTGLFLVPCIVAIFHIVHVTVKCLGGCLGGIFVAGLYCCTQSLKLLGESGGLLFRNPQRFVDFPQFAFQAIEVVNESGQLIGIHKSVHNTENTRSNAQELLCLARKFFQDPKHFSKIAKHGP